MNKREYLNMLENRLTRYYDMEKDFTYHRNTFDLFAKSFVRNERFIGSKRATIYAYENNEYNFIKGFESIDKNQVDHMIDLLKSAIGDYVVPHDEHMFTGITGVMLLEDGILDKEVESRIKKFKYHKSFAFGLRGWADLRLIVVSLADKRVLTNKKGKEVQKFYQF